MLRLRKVKLSGASIIEAIVASVVFAIVFGISMGTMAKMSTGVSGARQFIETDQCYRKIMADTANMGKNAGTEIHTLPWGTIALNTALYKYNDELYEISVTIRDNKGREIARHKFLKEK